MSPNPLPNFPRITLPGLTVTPAQRATMDTINAQHEAWRGLKLGMAVALIRSGQQPHVRPPADETARRREASKAARVARRASR